MSTADIVVRLGLMARLQTFGPRCAFYGNGWRIAMREPKVCASEKLGLLFRTMR